MQNVPPFVYMLYLLIISGPICIVSPADRPFLLSAWSVAADVEKRLAVQL